MYKASPNYGNKEHVFSQVPEAQIPRSVFNRSHNYKTTLSSDYLVPFFVDEVLPGDTFNLRATLLARMATPLAPLMDSLYMDTFYFFVPHRLVWANFKKFMGEQSSPGDSTSFTVPQIVAPTSTGWSAESIYDYMGLPIGVPGVSISALPLRAYNRIYQDWFRDENIITSALLLAGDGPDTSTSYYLLKRCKQHDYFTSALPWPQKGTAVSIPLGTTAPVIGNGQVINVYNASDATLRLLRLETSGAVDVGVGPSGSDYMRWSTDPTTGNNPGLLTDLSSATAATINSLRQAFQLQKLMERDARGGTRYTEIVKAHFGVTSPDARLQRPEYLGGSSVPINITPVPQMSSPTGSYAQGRLAGYGVGVDSGSGFTKSFTEHGTLIGLVSIRGDLTYQQGINKMWLRSTKYDFYWPALANIGEQIIQNQEIYAVATSTPGDAGDVQNKAAFGYQERYAEMRYKPSLVTGKLRSTYSSPLDVWHLAQNFTSLPTLSTTFIQCATPMARVSAVSGEPNFILDCYINMKCARPMPVFGVPGLIDHF